MKVKCGESVFCVRVMSGLGAGTMSVLCKQIKAYIFLFTYFLRSRIGVNKTNYDTELAKSNNFRCEGKRYLFAGDTHCARSAKAELCSFQRIMITMGQSGMVPSTVPSYRPQTNNNC